MIRRLILIGVAAAALAGPVHAAPVPEDKRVLQVLKPEQIDPARLLPPPAADGSEEQKGDLAEVVRIHKTATAERQVQAKWDDTHESVELFFATLGSKFDLAKLPQTTKLLDAVENEQTVVAKRAKTYFKRKRPWAIDTSLVACDYKPGAASLTSYPSGHSTLGFSLGFVLAQLMPEKAPAILARARDYAFSRVVCGAHYPSDTEASHVLGTEMSMMMMREPGFAAQFQARTELKAAGLTAS